MFRCEQYKQQVLAACEFLEGQTEEMQTQLEEEMRKAASAQDFEKAAQLARRAGRPAQDHPAAQKSLSASLTRCPSPSTRSRDVRELARLLQLPEPPDRIEGFDISNISGTFAVASMVSFWRGRPDRSNYRRFKMKTVTGQDDFACMAETVRRRYTRLKK